MNCDKQLSPRSNRRFAVELLDRGTLPSIKH